MGSGTNDSTIFNFPNLIAAKCAYLLILFLTLRVKNNSIESSGEKKLCLWIEGNCVFTEELIYIYIFVVDNFKLYFRETLWGDMYWIHLAHNRDQWRAHVNMVMRCEV
jgi:hypothetical protein